MVSRILVKMGFNSRIVTVRQHAIEWTNFIQNLELSFQDKAFEDVVCQMVSILFRE